MALVVLLLTRTHGAPAWGGDRFKNNRSAHCMTRPSNSSHQPRLVLGSTSQFRRQLLERLGIRFTVAAPNVDETPLPGEGPVDLVARLARAKAEAVADRHRDSVVIGSDQVALF